MLIAGVISGLLMSSAFADQQYSASARASFSPQSWTSENSSDVVTIQSSVGDTYFYAVQIYVSKTILGVPSTPSTGVNVKNCGNVTHINPGSSAICQISNNNPTVTFSSDKADQAATGVFQVER